MTQEHEVYKGYVLALGIQMPNYGIHETNVYESQEQYELGNPAHSADSVAEAKAWVDIRIEPPGYEVIGSKEDLGEFIKGLPFMPEKGEPLPESVLRELYPSPAWDLMEAPISEYGRVVVEETARLLKEFMVGGNFVLREKFEESGWSSEDVIYTGGLVRVPTLTQYLVEIYVFFDWRDPTKVERRTVELFEEGPEEIWSGYLSHEGGQEAGGVLRGLQK